MALMATSGEFDRNKCSEYALPVLCLYTFPVCKNIAVSESMATERYQADTTSARRRLSTKATNDRKSQSHVPNQPQRHGKSPSMTSATRNQHLQHVVHVEHLCREDCEELERTVCRDPLDLVKRQTYGGETRYMSRDLVTIARLVANQFVMRFTRFQNVFSKRINYSYFRIFIVLSK